jgi:hypothetical protein
MSEKIQPWKKIDWQWVWISYCFLVVLHLLPTYILLGITRTGIKIGIDWSPWMFVGLAVIGWYVGYKSAGVTILEPAVAAVAYVLTIAMEFGEIWGRSASRSMMTVLVWMILSFVIVFVSAWVGEIWQQRKEKAAA